MTGGCVWSSGKEGRDGLVTDGAQGFQWLFRETRGREVLRGVRLGSSVSSLSRGLTVRPTSPLVDTGSMSPSTSSF